MARYTCVCGHHWSDITSRFDGYICWTHGEVQEALVRDLWSFAQACQTGRRAAWLTDYFGAIYPHDIGDESVASDILSVVSQKFSAAVFDCPACGRLMINEAGEHWRGYTPDHESPSAEPGAPPDWSGM